MNWKKNLLLMEKNVYMNEKKKVLVGQQGSTDRKIVWGSLNITERREKKFPEN